METRLLTTEERALNFKNKHPVPLTRNTMQLKNFFAGLVEYKRQCGACDKTIHEYQIHLNGTLAQAMGDIEDWRAINNPMSLKFWNPAGNTAGLGHCVARWFSAS